VRLGEANFSLAMEEFSDFIFEQGLMDIPLHGGNITWSIDREGPSWSRIDCFSFLPSGRLTFQTLFRVDYLGFSQITFKFFFIVVTCKGAEII